MWKVEKREKNHLRSHHPSKITVCILVHCLLFLRALCVQLCGPHVGSVLVPHLLWREFTAAYTNTCHQTDNSTWTCFLQNQPVLSSWFPLCLPSPLHPGWNFCPNLDSSPSIPTSISMDSFVSLSHTSPAHPPSLAMLLVTKQLRCFSDSISLPLRPLLFLHLVPLMCFPHFHGSPWIRLKTTRFWLFDEACSLVGNYEQVHFLPVYLFCPLLPLPAMKLLVVIWHTRNQCAVSEAGHMSAPWCPWEATLILRCRSRY